MIRSLSSTVRLATVFGIPIKVHWTFMFFLLWVIYIGQRMHLSMTGTGRLIGFTVVLFICVVLHELGHARMAARFDVRTKDIIISPIGGIARLLQIPDRPREELLIALAGPAVNVVIALLLFVYLHFFTAQGLAIAGDPARLIEIPSNFLPFLFVINIALVVFNLVPAFPMDGGRVLRALLSMRHSREVATRWAARIGHIISVVFLMIAFTRGDFIIAFIGVFVMVSASAEYRSVNREDLLNRSSVADIVRKSYTLLRLDDSMSKVIKMENDEEENDFLVADHWGSIQGVLHQEFIAEAKKQEDHEAPVAEYLSSNFEAVSSTLNLKKLLRIFQENGYTILPVLQSGQVLGVVDRNSLLKYLQKTPKLWAARRSYS